MTAAVQARDALYTRPFVLALCANLSLCLAGFLFVHFPGFLLQLGAGEAQIGRIMALSAVTSVLGGPLVGKVMDERGRKVVILGGCVLYLLVIALYLTLTALGPLLYLVRLLDGLAATMLYASLFTYGADLVPASRRTEGLAIFGSSGLLPLGLSAQLGDALLEQAGYRELFAWAGGFALLGFVLALCLPDTRPLGDGSPRRGVMAPALQRDLLPVWLAAFAFFFAVSTVFTFMKTYVAQHGHGSVGDFFSVYAVVALALRVFAGRLPDRVGTRRMVLPALLCYGAGLVLLARAVSAGDVLWAGALCGAGHGYAYPVLFSLVVERASEHERGAAMAVYTVVDWGGMFLSGPILGYAIEHMGYGNSFFALSLLLVLGIMIFHALDRPRREPS
ncbi:MAG: MFS transporter [Myxococcales bacterium]|nr:MFS transporter [Myxococcales bacterium]